MFLKPLWLSQNALFAIIIHIAKQNTDQGLTICVAVLSTSASPKLNNFHFHYFVLSANLQTYIWKNALEAIPDFFFQNHFRTGGQNQLTDLRPLRLLPNLWSVWDPVHAVNRNVQVELPL